MVICAYCFKDQRSETKECPLVEAGGGWGGRCLGRGRPTQGCDTLAGSEYWRSGAGFLFACTRPSHSLLGLTVKGQHRCP